ncbi:hypothetical protein [Haloarcula sp. Atlit-7R]|uniref:hypothetical protein n=1 Tax=Haloarcula sp. Atlit-7R TaxID=2282125 RepID=UPI001314F760|nr:hypothetical protein [Haloarcula sp. Atlit-7R]
MECGAVVTAPVEFDANLKDHEAEDGTTVPWSEYHSVTNSTEHQVACALEYLEELGTKLDVPTETHQYAAEVYAEGAIETLTSGRSTTLFIAACLTVAANECGSPIPASRIAQAAQVNSNSLRRVCRVLRQNLDVGTSPCPPRAYLADLARTLKLNESLIADADAIIDAIPSYHLSGKHPGAFAGAALYLAADGEVTQREVANATAVTTETIRLRVKECRECIKIQ